MCGLVGVAADTMVNDFVDVFKDMLIMDQIRGTDSTGIATYYGPKNETAIHKVPMDVLTMMGFKNSTNFFNTIYQGNKFLLGHNRAKTVGAPHYVNSHPFTHNHITMAHNGTLRADWMYQLKTGKEEDLEGVTDSEQLCLALAHMGVEDTFAKLQGAWALTWFDANEKELNFLRNKERPLWFSIVSVEAYKKSTEHKAIIYASEPWMIQGACWRNGLKYQEPKLLPVDKLLSVPLDSLPKIKNLADLGLKNENPKHGLKMKHVQKYEPPVVNHVKKQSGQHTVVSVAHGSTSLFNKWKQVTGIAEGDYLDFAGIHFEKYGVNARYGALKGHTIPVADEEAVQVEVNGIIQSRITEMRDYTGRGYFECVGKVVNIKENKHKTPVYVVSASSVEDDIHHQINLGVPKPEGIELKVNHRAIKKELGRKLMKRAEKVLTTVDNNNTTVPDNGRMVKMVTVHGVRYAFMDQWKKDTENGCAMCGSNLELGQVNNILWMARDTGGLAPLCPTCTAHLKQEAS